jgi:DNA polymerase elongation subunit (family B)
MAKLDYKTFKDEAIEQFLNGKNNTEKYIVNIETNSYTNEVVLFIDDPEKNKKYTKTDTFKPFIYVKDLQKLGIKFYENNRQLKKENIEKYKIKYKELRVKDNNGAVVDRLNDGYKYMFYTESSIGYQALVKFFSDGGINIYDKKIINDKIVIPNNSDYYKEGFNYFNEYNNLVYNTISKNYELLIENKYNFDIKSVNINLTSNFIANDGIENELLEIDEENIKSKDLIKFKDYYIFYDDSCNFYRVIFKNTIHENDIINIEYEYNNRSLFFTLKTDEQYLIQKNIRLFKGYNLYNEIHKLVFDIETTGLNPLIDRIFAIGSLDNRGFKCIDFVQEINNDDEERKIIINFFNNIKKLKPSILYGYNSEDFDFSFIIKRCELLNINIDEISKVYFNKPIKRSFNNNLKVGNESKKYTKTTLYGINILDIIHAVWRAQAINSNIKEAKLKYIAKFAKVNKPDRIYIQQNMDIYQTWTNNKIYLFNTNNGNYQLIPETHQLNPKNYLDNQQDYNSLITGKELINKYLLNDLQETLDVDKIYNESTFMLSKILPAKLDRVATIGGAASWNILMSAWSYENGLAIPTTEIKFPFTGGLSRTFKVGFFEYIYKEDFAGLYPAIELENYVFPKLDVTHALFRLLRYFKFTRDKYKKMAKDESLTENERKFYDALQLPIKILNNSNFGAFGSEYFNWADLNCAERITCSGRQYLRKMVHYFQKFGATPIVLDTDGCNFSIPEYIHYDINYNYHETPIHISTLTYEFEGKIYKGVDALVEKFNNEILGGDYMKLDNDGMWLSAANFSRKNYANLEYSTLDDRNIKHFVQIPKDYLDKENEFLENYIKEHNYNSEQAKLIKLDKAKPKYTGNTIKSKTMPEYIEEFINKGIDLILKNKPKEFIEYYYEYLTKIYCKQIPLKKIASKARIKQSIYEYQNRGKDINGRDKGRKAYMELIIENNLNVSSNDFIYYVNNGTKKSHGDTSINKLTGKYNAYVISSKDLEENPNMLGEYNVPRYIENFNKRVKSLLSVFPLNIKNSLIKTDPTQREYYTEKDMFLTNYESDSIEDFFTLEEKEVNFWNRTGLMPDELFTEFKTVKPINSKNYIVKYETVKNKLLELNINKKLKKQYENYTNDDLVLTLEQNYYINNNIVNRNFNKILKQENVYIPLKNNTELLSLYKLDYNEINEENVYIINEVINGELKPIKEV